MTDQPAETYPSQITVFCDHCGTEWTGDYLVTDLMTRDERLAVARQHLVTNEGWEHTNDGDDFCPAHASPPVATRTEWALLCRPMAPAPDQDWTVVETWPADERPQAAAALEHRRAHFPAIEYQLAQATTVYTADGEQL